MTGLTSLTDMPGDDKGGARSAPPADIDVLEAAAVSVQYGGNRVLGDVSLVLHRGAVTGLVGPNGAGKTTLINVLSGYVAPSNGNVFLDGRSLLGATPDVFARRGICRTFQAGRLFTTLTTKENIEVASVCAGRNRAGASRRAQELAEELRLVDYMNRAAGTLPYGIQRRLAIARALASEPRILLLDEPAAGLDDLETVALADDIRFAARQYAVGLLLVEHNIEFVRAVCETVHVLVAGEILFEGTPQDAFENEDVVEAYIGT